MSDDPEELLKFANQMLTGAATAQVVSQVVSAYDGFAMCALRSLVSRKDITETMPAAAVAEVAWDFADKMMEERRKRGLGGVPRPEAGA